ncbi:hypothetical protein GCM10022215_24040 [Nocardioides fonticola]|uniref:Endonuclease/exonuclease/phosphatase domain-containing protein n=1 Tax=Nocardioides fonticola TaxID=450363 RepID=A0ABP7XKQ8_9ACTN
MSVRERVAGAGERVVARVRRPRLRILTWNVKTGRPLAQVRGPLDAWIRDHRPHVVVLQECYTIARGLRAVYEPLGWQVIHDPSNHPEADDVVILVRARRRIVRRGWIQHLFPWVGPVHDLQRKGRSFPWVEFDFAGHRIHLVGLHRIPVPGRNAPSFEDETQLLVDAEASIPAGRVRVWIGDMNIRALELLRFARQLGGTAHPGAGYDAAITDPDVDVEMTELDRGGSDHRAVLATLRLPRQRKARP